MTVAVVMRVPMATSVMRMTMSITVKKIIVSCRVLVSVFLCQSQNLLRAGARFSKRSDPESELAKGRRRSHN